MEEEWIVPVVDAQRCDGCGLCLLACTNSVLAVSEGVAVVKRPALCSYDGVCALICPKSAITLRFHCYIAEHKKGDAARSGE